MHFSELVILAIDFAEEQVSQKNLEEFLQSKELQTHLNKALAEITLQHLKRQNLVLSDQGLFKERERRLRKP